VLPKQSPNLQLKCSRDEMPQKWPENAQNPAEMRKNRICSLKSLIFTHWNLTRKRGRLRCFSPQKPPGIVRVLGPSLTHQAVLRGIFRHFREIQRVDGPSPQRSERDVPVRSPTSLVWIRLSK
jgi:hypothetical protein